MMDGRKNWWRWREAASRLMLAAAYYRGVAQECKKSDMALKYWELSGKCLRKAYYMMDKAFWYLLWQSDHPEYKKVVGRSRSPRLIYHGR